MSEKKIKVGYVAIVGQPNGGKSTLLNNLLDFKVAAVTRKPQTTRHQIRGILNGEDHQIIFFDTPGLLEPKYKLQEAMRQAAFRSLKDADLVLFMVAAAKEPHEFDTKLLNQIHDFNSSIIVVLNKMDIISKNQVLPVMEYYSQLGTLKSIMPISALKKDGLDSLKEEILSALPTGQPFYDDDQIMDHPERFVVSELIREKIFQRYGEEIPYATTVQIDEFKERKDGKDFIRAIIYVEKASQKGILIGKKGAALKDVGRIARQEIEHLLERKVFLEPGVKLKEKWRQVEKMLKEVVYYN